MTPRPSDTPNAEPPPRSAPRPRDWLDDSIDDRMRLAKEVERLKEALTPSGETKAAYIGEFTFALNTGPDEFGDDRVIENVIVPWTTIKAIMATILARAARDFHTKNSKGG